VRVEVAGVDPTGCLGDASLALIALTPGSPDESRALLEVLHQLGQRCHLERVLLAEVQRPLIEVALEAVEVVPEALGEADRRDRRGGRPAGPGRRSRASRSTRVTWRASTSLGPTSSRSGTPFSSQRLNFAPGRSSLQSTRSRMRSPSTAQRQVSMKASTRSRS